MASINGNSGSTPEKPRITADRMALGAYSRASHLARLNDEERTALLANAIVEALLDRGLVARADLCRSGLSDHDIERLYPDAITLARALEPDLFEGALA
ncbi:MAG TPA: hypothetical protein VGM17_02370 [Rhizomicrobium sp.]|jgi:hypothetical protein